MYKLSITYKFLKWGRDWRLGQGDLYFWGILRVSAWSMYGWMRSPDPFGAWLWIFRLGPIEYRKRTPSGGYN